MLEKIPTTDTGFWRRETTWAGIIKLLLDTASTTTAMAALLQAQGGVTKTVVALSLVALVAKLLASYVGVAANWLARLATVRLANLALPGISAEGGKHESAATTAEKVAVVAAGLDGKVVG